MHQDVPQRRMGMTLTVIAQHVHHPVKHVTLILVAIRASILFTFPMEPVSIFVLLDISPITSIILVSPVILPVPLVSSV